MKASDKERQSTEELRSAMEEPTADMPRCSRCNAETALSGRGDELCVKCFEQELLQLKEKNQTTLITFLQTDLATALTILDTAVMAAAEKHADHARAALEKVEDAAVSIRRLSAHIEDQNVRERIRNQVMELEGALSKAKSGDSGPNKIRQPS